MVAELVTEISKKNFCVLTAMFTKALARSEPNRPKFVELPFNRAAGYVATEEAVTSPFKPDLEWRRIVSGKRHEIDCSAKGQRTIFERIGAPKDFRVTERGDIKILENAFTIPLIVTVTSAVSAELFEVSAACAV